MLLFHSFGVYYLVGPARSTVYSRKLTIFTVWSFLEKSLLISDFEKRRSNPKGTLGTFCLEFGLGAA